METSKVYFTDLRTTPGNDMMTKLVRLVKRAGIEDIDFKGRFTAIKIHFGEPGNLAYIRPNYAAAIVDLLRSLGAKVFLTDSNTLYSGGRSNAVDHLHAAMDNGFNPIGAHCDVIIADGLIGTDYKEIPVGGQYCPAPKIGSAIANADIIISMNHFKGHEQTGFGGAIKNLGMGSASVGGKLELHSSSQPVIDENACIGCRICEKYCRHNAITVTDRKAHIDYSKCVGCGQCVAVCPTGALTERDHTNRLLEDLSNPEKTVIVQTAPAVRAALGEEFGMPAGSLVTGKMVYALRELGFDYVFDTDFAADLTIMEEGTEILNRLTRFLDGDKSVRLPILTSCCPAWVNFFEHQFPDMLDIPSTARSPQQMFGSIAKTYWAEKMGIPRENLVVVSIMPCLAKKYECDRDEFKTDGNPDVDYSLSTRELARLIKRANIGFQLVPDSEFDNPLGASTGAGVIFGTSGGVMEAALRSVYEIYTGKKLEHVEFENVRGTEGVRRASIDLNGFELKVGIAHGLGNARRLLNEIREGKNEYHVIEIMACPGGCIGGGGQPMHHGNAEILQARTRALYAEDAAKPLRKSHENPFIQQLYEEYLGKPMSEKAHALLHTHYFNKSVN